MIKMKKIFLALSSLALVQVFLNNFALGQGSDFRDVYAGKVNSIKCSFSDDDAIKPELVNNECILIFQTTDWLQLLMNEENENVYFKARDDLQGSNIQKKVLLIVPRSTYGSLSSGANIAIETRFIRPIYKRAVIADAKQAMGGSASQYKFVAMLQKNATYQ